MVEDLPPVALAMCYGSEVDRFPASARPRGLRTELSRHHIELDTYLVRICV